MKFYLTYKGDLFPSGNSKKRPSHKHSVRREFHQQLKRLWKIDEGLQTYTKLRRFDDSDKTYFEPHIVGKYRFISLVRKELKLSCSLDILFLRRDSSSGFAGDIDNRIKTLIDSLRCPSEQELKKDEDLIPRDDEHPFYCLLEDDDRIGSFAVTVDTLLDPRRTDNKAENDDKHLVELVIMVEIRPSIHTPLNSNFL